MNRGGLRGGGRGNISQAPLVAPPAGGTMPSLRGRGASTPTRGGTPNMRGGTPNMRGGTPNMRGGTPNMRGGTPNTRGGTTNPRGGTPNMRGGTPNMRGGTPNIRGGTPNMRGGTPNTRGGTPNARGGTPNTRGGTPITRGGAPIMRGATPSMRGSTPNTRGGTPNNRGGTPNMRGGTPTMRGGTPMRGGGAPFGNSNRGGPAMRGGARGDFGTNADGSDGNKFGSPGMHRGGFDRGRGRGIDRGSGFRGSRDNRGGRGFSQPSRGDNRGFRGRGMGDGSNFRGGGNDRGTFRGGGGQERGGFRGGRGNFGGNDFSNFRGGRGNDRGSNFRGRGGFQPTQEQQPWMQQGNFNSNFNNPKPDQFNQQGYDQTFDNNVYGQHYQQNMAHQQPAQKPQSNFTSFSQVQSNPGSVPPPPPAPEWAEWELKKITDPTIQMTMKRMSEDVRFRALSEREQRIEWDNRLSGLMSSTKNLESAKTKQKQDERKKEEADRKNNEQKKKEGGYAALKEIDRLKNFNWKNLPSYNEADLKIKLEQLRVDKEKCEKEYHDWQRNCEMWKLSHANHPNKKLFEKYNNEWKETDKKLKHGQQLQDQKIQKLEDELFARQTDRPPSPPPFVKDMHYEGQQADYTGIKQATYPVQSLDTRQTYQSYRSPPHKTSLEGTIADVKHTPTPIEKKDVLPDIDFNLLKTVVSTVTAPSPQNSSVEEPGGPKPNLLEVQPDSLLPKHGMPNRARPGQPIPPVSPTTDKPKFDLTTFQPYDYGKQASGGNEISSIPTTMGYSQNYISSAYTPTSYTQNLTPSRAKYHTDRKVIDYSDDRDGSNTKRPRVLDYSDRDRRRSPRPSLETSRERPSSREHHNYDRMRDRSRSHGRDSSHGRDRSRSRGANRGRERSRSRDRMRERDYDRRRR